MAQGTVSAAELDSPTEDRVDTDGLARELDALRDRVRASLGARDAAYIRRLIRVQRRLELGSRAVLVAGPRSRTTWALGTAGLAVAKILDNMEIGHNVLHGQWDWMRDPKIHSTTWEWDHASPAAQWQRAHNQTHHRFTNIVGHDNDLGYGIMRVSEGQPWQRWHLAQPLLNLLTACVFEWGIAMYDADLGPALAGKSDLSPDQRARLRAVLAKIGRQVAKDFVVLALLAAPRGGATGVRRTLAAAAVANLVRNLWSHSVIMCGHFPEGVETFEADELDLAETRGEWYLRQMRGSANISGGPLLHLLTGNLSHQVEHHLFPDLPSNRYAEIAAEVEPLRARHGLAYHSAPFPQQLASAWHRVLRPSVPDGWPTRQRHRLTRLTRLTRLPGRRAA